MDMNPQTEKPPVSVHTRVVSGPTVTVLNPKNGFSFLKHDSVLWKQGDNRNCRWAEPNYPSCHPRHNGRPWMNQNEVFQQTYEEFQLCPEAGGRKKEMGARRQNWDADFAQATETVAKWLKVKVQNDVRDKAEAGAWGPEPTTILNLCQLGII